MNDGSHHEFNLINRIYDLCEMREYATEKKIYERIPIFIVLIMQ